MADWPVWVWVLIVVIALIIVIAIVLGIRKKDHVDPDGPFADEHHSHAPGEPRRGVEPDPTQDDLVTEAEPAPLGRRVDSSSLIDEDEETLNGPLVIPDEPVPNRDDDAAAAAGRYSEGYAPAAPADEPAADFAAEDRQQEINELALEPELTEDPTAWGEPDRVADAEPLPVGESEPEPASPAWGQDAVEDEDAEDEDIVGDTLPLHGPDHSVQGQGSPEPPSHADRDDYGSPMTDSRSDDDVPRDAQGRRLDPYGNPIDG